jgi:predicted Zn-dependent peptidase
VISDRFHPPITEVHISISLPYPEIEPIGGGEFHFFSYGQFPNCSIALLYPFGDFHASPFHLYGTMLSLLLQGSKTHPYPHYKKELQRLGSVISPFFHYYNHGFTINAISIKGLEHALHLLKEAIENPEFNEKLIASQKKLLREQLEIQKKKPTWQANRLFMYHLFGPNHPLGHVALEEELQMINPQSIQQTWEAWGKLFPHRVICVSNFSPGEIKETLQRYFSFHPSDRETKSWPIVSQKGYFYVPMDEESTQAAIRIGKPLPGFNHADYFPLRFAIIAFGGFFGSRLMQKIREEEGLTYGIYAQYSALPHMGYLKISADTSKPYQLLDLIQQEMKRLHAEPFTNDELNRLKNYLKGTMLSLYDSPGSVFDFLFSCSVMDRRIEEGKRWLQFIESVTIQELEKVIYDYLDWESLLIVHAGKKD